MSTTILPQEAAVIFAARNFLAACGEISITDLPEQTRAAFAALEATTIIYDNTVEYPSEVVEAEEQAEPRVETVFNADNFADAPPGTYECTADGSFVGKVYRLRLTPTAEAIARMRKKQDNDE